MKQERIGPLYDQFIAEQYDDYYKTSETGLFLTEYLPKHIKESTVLDIGCGTGWLLDYQKDIINPENYLGVDTSFPMSKKLKEKHPEYHVVNSNVTSIIGKFDIGLGIFGPLSYMNSWEVKHLTKIIDKKIFLMGYNHDAYSKILKNYGYPVVRGEITPTMEKYEILNKKFKNMKYLDLSEYIVFTNFKNADEIKNFNDARKAAIELSATA
jgi:SAM-dependent methyltransferase